MIIGISDAEIERVFKDVDHSDLNETFLGVFPSNKINKFVMFEKIMPEKQYSFIISNADRKDQPAHIGGVFWTFLRQLNYCFSIPLGQLGQKIS